MVLPDQHCRFPWDPGFAAEMRTVQPLLAGARHRLVGSTERMAMLSVVAVWPAGSCRETSGLQVVHVRHMHYGRLEPAQLQEQTQRSRGP